MSGPILFTGGMVRAIIAGIKTQTRRIVTDRNSRGNYKASELLLDDPRVFADPGPSPAGNPGWYLHAPVNAPVVEARRRWNAGDCDPTIIDRLYPWVFEGDKLWVRETGWQRPERTPKMMREGADTWERYYYDADGLSEADHEDFKKWGFKRRPSIFMPRWASRITLEITGIRVERLQDISEEDAKAEGCVLSYDAERMRGGTLRGGYRTLWESINGKGSWTRNPWVWVVEFKARIKK